MSVDTAPSAYPRSVEELLPLARELPTQPDGLPARNLLMRTYRIGAPKADEIRDLLTAEAVQRIEATTPDPDDEPDPWTYSEPEPDPAGEPDRSASEAETVPPAAPAAVATTLGPAPADSTDIRVPEPPQAATEATAATPAGRGWSLLRRSQTSTDTRAQGEATPAAAAVVARRPVVVWPVMLLMLPAFVAVWAGWVGLGRYTGFGVVNLLPGIAPDGGFATIDSAITLPIGMEVYAAYALYVWLSGRVPQRARRFAMGSALAALSIGALGQIAYHILAAPPGGAPWQITTAVACLPVAVLGMGAALAHMVRAEER